MSKGQSSAAKSGRRVQLRGRLIEGLELRTLLNGVVLGTPVDTNTANAGIAPIYTDLVDLNGDGKADLVTSNVANGSVSNSLSILPGNGDGTFGTAQTFPLSFSPLTIVDGQLGTNNKPDLVVGSTSDNSVEVFLQDNLGNFTGQTLTASGLATTQSVTIGDFFGNGREDIAVASFDNSVTNNIAIFRNNGNGTFTLTQSLSVNHAHLSSLTSFTQSNGTVDLAVSESSSNTVTVLLNNGSGTFSVGPDYNVGSTPVTIKSGKFDLLNNNNDDLVTANATGGNVSVLLGNGDGTFVPNAIDTALSGVAPGGGPGKVRVANVNADSFPDLMGLLSAGSSGDGEVLLGNGDGTFHVGSVISVSDGARTSMAAGDLAGNGLTGLVLANANVVTALVNVTNQDHTPPTATVNAGTTSAAGSATIQFVVNYNDNTQVDASTLNSNNITVTDPSGNAQPVTLVSSNLANGATVSATYSIPAPSGALGVSDNGTYTVTATSNTANAAKDANGNPVASGTIGTFTVAVSLNGPNLVAGAVKVKFPATGVVSGVSRIAGANVQVVNAGNALASGKIVINLYANTDQTTVSGGTLVSTITRNVRLRPGARITYAFPAFTWPAGQSGSYFLVADVNATSTLAETTQADNISSSATAASVAAPFIDISNLWNGKTPATFKAGRRVALSVLIKNLGNVPARRPAATATILASATGSLSDAVTLASGVPLHIAAAANGKQALPVGFTVPATLASGQYHLIVTLNVTGDSNAANDTVIASGTFTI